MKILLVVGHEGIYSGASYQALYLALGLKERGHEVQCVWGPQGGDPSLEPVCQAGLKLHTISMRGKFDLTAIASMRSLLRREKFDVVHCFKGMAMYRVLWAGWGLKFPALIFNREVSKPLEYFQGSKYRSAKVDLVVADSEAVRKILSESGRLPTDRISVVYDEVDLERYHPGIDGGEVRREFGLAPDAFFCGIIGNWSPWRGQEYFLQAIAQLKQLPASANLQFLLVGKATDSLRPLAQQLGIESCLHFTGFRTDLESVVAALDLVVNSSIAVESLPGAITIAMAMGKPVVGTAIAGTPELIEEGRTGYLVPLADPAAMAAAIRKIADLEPVARSQMGQIARRKMETGFSRSVRAQRMESIYLQIIQQKSTKVH